MTPEQRIDALERELAETRLAAVEMITHIVGDLMSKDDWDEDVQRAFDSFARAPDTSPVKARLASMIAEELRDQGR